MNKAILLSDVKQVKDKYICFDEDYTCPLFNREKWKCQYRINTKTEDCPLKPLPKNKVYSIEDCVTLEYGKTIEGPNYYYKVGYNHCLGEILKVAGEEE